MSARPLEAYAYQRFVKFWLERFRVELCVSCCHSDGDRFKGKPTVNKLMTFMVAQPHNVLLAPDY